MNCDVRVAVNVVGILNSLLATYYCSIQSYFKIEFDLTTLFNAYFLCGKS